MFSICHMLCRSLHAWSPSLVYSRLNVFTTVTYTLHRLVQCVRPKYLVALGSFLRFVLGVAFRAARVYYCWVNSKAMAEGRECNSFLCYEVVKAAACMA